MYICYDYHAANIVNIFYIYIVTYPSAVNLTVVKVTHTGQTSSVTVAWDPPRRVTAHQVSSYTVQIQSSRDPSIFQQSTYAVGSNLMHTFRRLKPDITYSIDVIVSYEGGDSNAIRIKVRLNYSKLFDVLFLFQ